MAGLGEGRPTKRRAGADAGGLAVADPRPVFDGGAVLGARCTTCRYPVPQRQLPWCPVCYGELVPERFAATGSVWSSTVVAIPVGTRRPPFGLAYVDLDDGPRVLAHLADAYVLAPGSRVRIVDSDEGDLVAAREVR
ncbi:hypothetical protein FPZ12_018580 [Amycolatopsis acidicola]|uniref:ChsH2 C-terminal OB-fold domain-containing protein n=1 Tax=Amycolatopsis acidicola TaxID=2596893 RepID=A0A5N0V0U9_9PSEU|nr:OB-fold domain-containing protein [Amycolatopsis acidicola]KAA9160099.1 hypothetical protein FPZ12_018580 [Amycolatopsis acidicola]